MSAAAAAASAAAVVVVVVVLVACALVTQVAACRVARAGSPEEEAHVPINSAGSSSQRRRPLASLSCPLVTLERNNDRIRPEAHFLFG